MNKKQSQDLTRQPCGCQENHDPGEKGSGNIAFERNRYFTGKFMTARDFQVEQDYFMSRHRLHNRLLHGWGIVCGLEVEYHPNRLAGPPLNASECAKRWVRVRPGIAIDCFGRELVLRKDWYYELPLPQPPKENAAAATRKEQYILGLLYCEEEIECVPVLYAEDVCDGKREQSNRLRECARLEWKRRGELPAGCWRDALPELERLERELLHRLREVGVACSLEQLIDYINVKENGKVGRDEIEAALYHLDALGLVRLADDRYMALSEWPCHDDCAEGRVSHVGSCLDLDGSCGREGLVPLALIEYDPAHPEWDPDHPETGFRIDTLGRRELPPSPDQLTHIAGYNWQHGGMLFLSELARPKDEGGMGGRLEVYFDRKLWQDSPPRAPEDGDEPKEVFHPIRLGVNEFTFIVEWHRWSIPRRSEESWYRLRLLHNRKRKYKLLPHVEQGEKRCMAVYPLPADLLEGEENIGNSWLHVILKCDFILDCRGIPVDGNHLRGRYLTGNGQPGGTFESWFYIKDDLSDKAEEKENRR